MANMISNNRKRKNKLDTQRTKANPSKSVNYTREEKEQKKREAYFNRHKTIGIDQDTYDILTTWQSILTDKHKVPFKQVIQKLNQNVLKNMDPTQREEFEDMKKTAFRHDKTKNDIKL